MMKMAMIRKATFKLFAMASFSEGLTVVNDKIIQKDTAIVKSMSELSSMKLNNLLKALGDSH